MAEAKRCARCGNFYQERERNAFDALADALRPITMQKTALSNIAVIEKFLDLCPGCSKSLRKWVCMKDGEDTETSVQSGIESSDIEI